MRDNKVVIRKYENRRLYDTAHSRYVNLDEIAQMVRDGSEVQVIDARTGEDITRLILTQIIVEDAKERDSALPLDLLQQLVAASGRAGQESVARYLRAFFDMYRSAADNFQARMQPPAALPLTPLDFMQSLFARGAPAPAQPAPPAEPAPEPGPELDELRRRVAELERKLSRPRKQAARKRNRSA